ncbi:hypothetical protein D3C87_1599920 [compost metagenome]
MEDRGREQRVHEARLVLHAGLELLSLLRAEGLGRATGEVRVRVEDRVEEARGADIGRQAVGELVGEAGATAPGGLFLVVARREQQTGRADRLLVDVVVAAVQRDQPAAAEADLVLGVEAELVMLQVLVEIDAGHALRRAEDRVGDADRGGAARGLGMVDVEVFVVDAEEQ